MFCRNCGHENAAQASLCANCGAAIGARSSASDTSTFAASFGGLIVGVVCTGLIWSAGTVFERIGASANRYDPQGAAWFYLAALVATIAALVVLFLRPVVRKMNGSLRIFLLVALFVLFGGMSLCNVFTSSLLFRA